MSVSAVASPLSTVSHLAHAPGLARALAAARTAAENRATDVVLLDLRKLTAICDFFLIATGASQRQLHAISEEIDRTLEEQLGDSRLGREGFDESRWILQDFGDVVVHLFDEETRKFYDLEGLWGDAVRVDLSEALRGTAPAMSGI